MKYTSRIILALAGLFLFASICARYAPDPDAAKREMVLAANADNIFVLDAVSGIIYELRETRSGEGAFRTLSYRPENQTEFHQAAQIDDRGIIRFYGADSSGPFQLAISEGDDGFVWDRTGFDMNADASLIAIDPLGAVMTTSTGITIVADGRTFAITPPRENLASPVAARNPNGDWVVIWPAKIESIKPERRAISLDMTGYGKPGRFAIQVISPAGDVSEYELENESFVESRATTIVGAVVDNRGRLIMLDDKGYISTFNGTDMLSNVYAQLTPSRYAKNAIAPGPGETVIVTDAVSNMVNMINPMDGKVIASWRLPSVKRENIAWFGEYWNIGLDLLLLLVIIIFIIRIRSRMRRYRQYRAEGEK